MQKVKQEYIVSGHAPAISKQANDFMKSCDLGGEGAFVEKNETVILTINPRDIDKAVGVLKQAYEQKMGWTSVFVQSI
jgi:hypothetical protein